MRSRRSKAPLKADDSNWRKILDCRVPIRGGEGNESVKQCIKLYMIDPILQEESSGHTVKKLHKSIKRSALLFGPPGAGKTQMVRAISEAIGWEFVEVLPSDFLVHGLEGVYSSANSIFQDLQDLDRAVVFFDEMDALLQRRVDEDGKQTLTVQQQFMTTSMLPHLAELYGAGRVLFFFATNYRQSFDTAITRPGRFDMLLFVGPPDWRKLGLESIGTFASFEDNSKTAEIGPKLLEWIPPSTDVLSEMLTRATFAEFRGMLRQLCSTGAALDAAIAKGTVTRESFRSLVEEWSQEEFSLCMEESL